MEHVVLITGASSGIGKALAEEFANHGADLLIAARSEGKLAALQAELEQKYKVHVFYTSVDLTEENGCRRLYDYAKEKQLAVDILINNAGMGDAGEYEKSDWDKDCRIIRLNVLAVMHLCRLFLPDMTAGKQGTIVNIASTLAFAPTAWEAVYAASKAFILSFSQALYEETKGSGVRVLTICPGMTNTDFFRSAGFGLGSFRLAAPEDFAAFAYKQIMKKKPVSVHRFSNQITALFSRLAPRGTVRRCFARACRPDNGS